MKISRVEFGVILLFGIALGLAGCQSEQERRAEWITQCATQDFTAKQCEVLYSIAKDTRDAKNSAAAANFATGLSIGIATGR